jgi:hypothetical protein
MITLGAGTYSNSASLNYTAQTGCGVVNGYVGFTVYKSFSFRVAPSVTTNMITVQTEKKPMNDLTVGKDQPGNKIYIIKVLDQNGTTMKTFEYNKGFDATTISLASLQPGLYFISAYNGLKWSSEMVRLIK